MVPRSWDTKKNGTLSTVIPRLWSTTEKSEFIERPIAVDRELRSIANSLLRTVIRVVRLLAREHLTLTMANYVMRLSAKCNKTSRQMVLCMRIAAECIRALFL